ncbi:MAG: metallophosphoesterase [Oscillospiraceae bacterium]|nr:metallophosphoesterase [Oscillospiraceae bacterium]
MLYVIGDLHLSFEAGKPMDVFGDAWKDHVPRLLEGFGVVTGEDVTVLCGDLTWGISMEDSLEDFRFIDELPGKKIILKGNHDYWWSTASKAKKFFEEHELNTIDILNNNCFFYGDTAICGTRGWFCDPMKGTDHDRKMIAREAMRLEASLKAAEGAEKIQVFMHYPPRFGTYIMREITDLLESYRVSDCWYGHLHGPGIKMAVTGVRGGVDYHLISADYLGFKPVKVL